jgi:hypothetical protein
MNFALALINVFVGRTFSLLCRIFAAKRRKTILIRGLNQWLAWPKCFGISGPF